MSSNKSYHCEPWSPAVKETANELIRAIKAVAPELEVLFMGAAALELPGKNDIDLDILCKVDDITRYASKLKPVLGEPSKSDSKSTFWSFHKNGFEIDAILSDPSISHVPLQRARFEKLKSDSRLREKYCALKIECDGLPYEEYEKKKLAFLDEEVISGTNAI